MLQTIFYQFHLISNNAKKQLKEISYDLFFMDVQNITLKEGNNINIKILKSEIEFITIDVIVIIIAASFSPLRLAGRYD